MLVETVFRYSVLYGLIVLTVFGCSVDGNFKEERPVGDIVDTQTGIKRGTVFAWGERNFNDAPGYRGMSTDKMLESLIVDELGKKGLRYSNYAEAGGLLFDYTVDLGSEFNGSGSPDLPELAPAIGAMEQGKLKLELRNNVSGKVVWQDSVAGFTDTQMPSEMRAERLLKLVEILIEDIPVSTD
jgi:hypothetical protein